MAQNISDAHILVSMTYVSRANQEISTKEIGEILQQAQHNLSLIHI